MALRGKVASVSGAEGPLGAALLRALAEAGARVDAGPCDLLVEATPVPLPGAADPMAWEAALLAAARPVLALSRDLARLRPGGAALLLTVPSGPLPAASPWWDAALAWRSAAVAGLAREGAARGLRVNGLVASLDAEAGLPAFLRRAPGPGADPAEVASVAVWLLGAGVASGVTLPFGR